MDTLRQGPRVAVPSTVTKGKWWVFSETKSDMYAIGMIHKIDDEFIANRLERVEGRLRSYPHGEAYSLYDAMTLFREV